MSGARVFYPPGGGGTGGADGFNVIAAGSQTANTTGTILFSNSNGVTFGMSNNSVVTASVAGGAGNTGSISAGTTRGTLGEVVFSNSNGLSFGINGQTLTGSYTVPSTAGLLSAINVSAGTTSTNASAVTFSNSNGVSFGLNAGVVTASHNGLTTQSGQAFSADASSTFQTLSLQNSNGISFSNNAGAVRLTHDLQYTSNTSAITSNALNTSVSRVINAVVATNNTGGGTASLSGNVSFSNANGATFYSSAGNAVVLSYSVPNVPAQTNQTIGVYGSSQTTGQSSSSTYDARSFTIRGAGIVSVGNSGGEVIISATGGGAADGGVGISAGANSVSNGTVVFSNSNGVSFGLNGSTVTASYTVPTVTNSSWTVSDAVTSGTVGRLAFTNLNGVTLSLSTGAGGSHTIVGSHNALTSQSNQAFSASGGSSTFQTLSFANSNGLTFSNSNGSVIGSYTVPSTAGLLSAVNFSAGTTSNNSASIRFADSNGVSFGLNAGTITATVRTDYLTSQTNQTIGAYAVSNTIGQSSSSTIDARSLSFQGAGIASVGYSGGSVIISVPAGGGGGDGVNILAAGTQTANTTGTIVFSNSNGVTFGMSNSSVITASVNAGGAAGSMSYWEPYQWLSGQQLAQGSLFLQPIYAPANMTATQADALIHISNSSSAGGTLSMSIGLYTYSGSTASRVSSSSQTYGFNSTAANSSYTRMSGTRYFSVSCQDWNITPGNYLQAVWMSSSSSGTSGTYSVFGRTVVTINPRPFDTATMGSDIFWGIGVLSATTNAMPNSIHLTDFRQTAGTVARQPWIRFMGTQ